MEKLMLVLFKEQFEKFPWLHNPIVRAYICKYIKDNHLD